VRSSPRNISIPQPFTCLLSGHAEVASAAEANSVHEAGPDVTADGVARPLRARRCVQFCVQFAPDLCVQGAVKLLVEVSRTTRVNLYGLGADIF
jgi:hypothetical protein